jgi:hypothetical protein
MSRFAHVIALPTWHPSCWVLRCLVLCVVPSWRTPLVVPAVPPPHDLDNTPQNGNFHTLYNCCPALIVFTGCLLALNVTPRTTSVDAWSVARWSVVGK